MVGVPYRLEKEGGLSVPSQKGSLTQKDSLTQKGVLATHIRGQSLSKNMLPSPPTHQ